MHESNTDSKDAPGTKWLWSIIALLVIAFVIFALPASMEGPVLIPISPGHALSTTDMVALVPLLLANALLYYGFWRGRSKFWQFMSHSPGGAFVSILVAGIGLGLLIASAFSGFFGWWAIGAIIFCFFVIAAAVALVYRG